MKRYLVVFLLLLLPLLVASCIQGHAHYTLNRDGSVDVSIRLGAARGLIDLLYGLEQGESVESILEGFELDGYEIMTFVEDDIKGFEAIKHFPRPEDLFSDTRQRETFSETADFLDIEKGLFFDSYKFDIALDLRDRMGQYYALANETFLARADFKFILTLPISLKEHNASWVSEDGLTYKWDISLMDLNRLSFVLKRPKLLAIGAVASILLALLATGIIFALKAVRRRGPQLARQRK